MPPAYLTDLTCPHSVGRPKHMRVMAGALEGDLFIGPKAEVMLRSLPFPGFGVFTVPGASVGSELSCGGPQDPVLSTMCQVPSWAV